MDVGPGIPSLLDREATGGAIASAGLSFQEAILVSYIPRWLAQEGFTAAIREHLGDFEARFFVPGRGFVKELVEAKDHSLAPAEFWQEIDRFKAIASGSPGVYRWFTLVSTGLSDQLAPLANGLRRVRDPYAFLEICDPVKDASYAAYEERVLKLGRTADDARFLFECVSLEPEHSLATTSLKASFREALATQLPTYDLSQTVVDRTYEALATFTAGRTNKPMARLEIERVFRNSIPDSQRPQPAPIILNTTTDDTAPQNVLTLPWRDFFADGGRQYPPGERWEQEVMLPLREIKHWIEENREGRRIRLEGSRRLSSALALGYTFSAVAGFQVDMNHRGAIWSTDTYPDANTPAYHLAAHLQVGDGKNLVVALSIVRDILPDVIGARQALGLERAPVLCLHGDSPIVSAEQLSLIVREVKAAISAGLRETGADDIHLFLAGPSYLALWLGHRLNATAPVQCYEWTTMGTYQSTCRLPT